MNAFTVPLLALWNSAWPLAVSTLLMPSAWAQTPAKPDPASQLLVDRVEVPGVIYFRYAGSEAAPPAPLKTGITDLMPIGQINPLGSAMSAPQKARSGEGYPYFIFSGYPCKDCKDSPNIYILRPDGRKPTSFIYPGKIVDPQSGNLLLSSRAFFGRCLWSSRTEGYVVFQQERVDRRRSLQASVFVAEPGEDHLNERLIERRLPRINDTLKLVRQKVCHEISGQNRTMLRKLLDLRPKRDPEMTPADEQPDGAEADGGNEESPPAPAPSVLPTAAQ